MSAAETIEEVAKALGVWVDTGKPCLSTYGIGWDPTGQGVLVFSPADQDSPPRLAEAEALILVCLLALPPDRETCPDCEGRKFKVETARTRDAFRAREWARSRRNRGRHVIEGSGDIEIVQQYSRPCSTCKGPDVECDAPCWPNSVGVYMRTNHGPGRAHLPRQCDRCSGSGHIPGDPRGYIDAWPWARHFLGAVTWDIAGKLVCGRCGDIRPDASGELAMRFVFGEGWSVHRGCECQDRHVDVDALTVFADRLQSPLDTLADALAEPLQDARNRATLGEGLALWLTRAPCRACRGRPIRITVHPSEVRAWEVTHYPLNWQHMRERWIEEGAWIEATRTTRGGFDVIACCRACRGSGLALGGHVPALEGVARRLVPPTVLQGEHG